MENHKIKFGVYKKDGPRIIEKTLFDDRVILLHRKFIGYEYLFNMLDGKYIEFYYVGVFSERTNKLIMVCAIPILSWKRIK